MWVVSLTGNDLIFGHRAQAEHLLHGTFVGESDDIVDSLASGRGKGGRLGVGQVQGRELVQNGPQAAVHGAVGEVLPPRPGVGGQFGYEALINGGGCRPPW